MTENFFEMTMKEQIDVVNTRIRGEHVDRIQTPQELLDLTGESIHVVLSPFGQQQDTGNGFVFEWVVGKVITQDFNEITSFDDVIFDDETKYICVHKEDDRYKPDFMAISLQDFNIIPNTYNNHAAFSTLAGAESYAMFRKLTWGEDDVLKQLIGEYNFWMTKEQITKET